MRVLDRTELASQIVERLSSRRDQLRERWQRDPISNLIVDDLFPAETARALFEAFPSRDRLTPKRSLGESRFLGERVDAYPPLLREAVYAFQTPRVIDAIGRLTAFAGLLQAPPANACGISVMERGSFLNPHVDGARELGQLHRQVLSALYYVTPDLRLSDGGHLELWHDGLDAEPTTILSKFNRLIVMATHAGAWHSVSPLRTVRHRCCIWSYYYLPYSAQPHNDNHVAAFRGRPEQKFRDLLLRADTFARQSLYRFVIERARPEQDLPLEREAEPTESRPEPATPQPSAARESGG